MLQGDVLQQSASNPKPPFFHLKKSGQTGLTLSALPVPTGNCFGWKNWSKTKPEQLVMKESHHGTLFFCKKNKSGRGILQIGCLPIKHIKNKANENSIFIRIDCGTHACIL